MHDALVGVIVGVSEEDVPSIGQRVWVDGKTVILAGDEAAVRPLVDARLVVAAVAVPERLERKGSEVKVPTNGKFASQLKRKKRTFSLPGGR